LFAIEDFNIWESYSLLIPKDVGGTAARQMMDYLTNGTPIAPVYAVGATIVEPGDDLAKIMPEYM